MPEKNTTPETPLALDIMRAGRDEMNLVEYPFAALAKHGKNARQTKIEQTWETRHPVSNRAVTARWRVVGDPELGLPSPMDERVYLVLMELTKEQGFKDPHVTFTRYDILQRLGWPGDKAHYDMLFAAFQKLKAVSISAENSFWDASVKSFRNVGFSLIDNFDIVAARPGRKSKGTKADDGPELALSWFKWNEVIFENARNGYMKTLDLGFALSLETPVSMRLYRYLDKKRRVEGDSARYHYQVGIHTLCERHLGMAPQRYVSTLKSRLEGAHAELIARGYLKSVQYLPMRSMPGEKVIYIFGHRSIPADQAPPREKKVPKSREEKDKKMLEGACDAVLAALPDDEREAIAAEAKGGISDIFWDRLNDPNTIVSHEYRRVMREIVQRDHADVLAKELRRMVIKSKSEATPND